MPVCGSFGGFICAAKPVIDLLINRSRSLIYATGLPPAAVAAASAALEIIETDRELVNIPMERAKRFTRQLCLPDPESTIVPLLTGTSERALRLSHLLEEEGFLLAEDVKRCGEWAQNWDFQRHQLYFLNSIF